VHALTVHLQLKSICTQTCGTFQTSSNVPNFTIVPVHRRSPKGMRIFAGNDWANLRLATFSSYVAGFFTTLPAIFPAFITQVRAGLGAHD
jgi:hypothetical protein